MREEEWRELRDTRLRALGDAPEAFGSTHAEALVRPDEWWRNRALDASAGADQAMFLAWNGGTTVGIAGVFDEGAYYRVISMWTDPRERGSGIGLQLLEAAVAHAGGAEVRLSVADGNEAARRLYERYGFVATGLTEPLRSNTALQIHELRLQR